MDKIDVICLLAPLLLFLVLYIITGGIPYNGMLIH